MQANEKKRKNLLTINNRTKHVLEEHKHAQTKTTKQQKTDSNLQPQKNGNHELETTASRQNAKLHFIKYHLRLFQGPTP